jgi:large subunit ribosomal protein L23
MATSAILIRPLITEKYAHLAEKELNRQYAFIVALDANKVEIRKAIESQYGVTLDSVRTHIMPSKPKNRFTRARVVKGRSAMYKKAIVTVSGNQSIDFYKDLQ